VLKVVGMRVMLRWGLMMLGMFLFSFRNVSGRCSVYVDLKSLELQGYEAKRCCDNWVGGFDSLKGENAELEFV
jgi:hypothetical protein